jgi:hypothetical protein
MSHYSVLVIGEDVEKQLQPYHEYECTGIEDEYVVEVNKNDEVKEFLEKEIYFGQTLNGDVDYHYNLERCEELGMSNIKKGTKLEYFTEKGLTRDEIDQEIIDYHGFYKVGNDWFRKTNPNAEWDWWVVGGRWSGFFKLKDGSKGELGKKSLFDTTDHQPNTADITKKGDINFDLMRDNSEKRAIKEYDLVFEGIKDTPKCESWESVRERMGNIDEARTFYNSQPRIEAFNKVTKENSDVFGWFEDYQDFNCTRDEYIKRERNRAITTYAIVKDGEWISKGKMGWWGMSSDSMSQDEWNEKYNELIDSLPDDTLLTIVDCHI